MLSLSEAVVLSTPLEAVLYGFSTFMFLITIRTLFRKHRQRKVNYGMVAASLSLFLLSTAEMGVNIARLYQGFITKGSELSGGPERYFASPTDPTFLVKSCLYNTQTVILDAVMIYRTFVVWESPLVVIVAGFPWCGLVVSSVALNVAFARATPDAEARDIFHLSAGHWVAAAYSLTLTTNLIATLLLAYKVWKVAKTSTQNLSESTLTPILRVIVESGAIYSFTITAALVAFVLQSNVVYIILDMIAPIISIVFSMIIVRISLAHEEGDRKIYSTTTQRTRSWPPPTHSGIIHRRGREDSMFQMQNITVDSSEVAYVDREPTTPGHDAKPPGIVREPEGEEQDDAMAADLSERPSKFHGAPFSDEDDGKKSPDP